MGKTELLYINVTYNEMIDVLTKILTYVDTPYTSDPSLYAHEIAHNVNKSGIVTYHTINFLCAIINDNSFTIRGKSDYMKALFSEELLYSDDTEFIDIKYFSNEIEELRLIDNKSDWIDLRSAVNISLKAGEHKLIPLGIGMILPEGYEAHIVPRSSTFKNWGIIQTNHMGVIDESYCGDNDQWIMSVYATRDTEIKVNDRICQFRIIKKQPPIKFRKVDKLKETDRGGFGSTGKQ